MYTSHLRDPASFLIQCIFSVFIKVGFGDPHKLKQMTYHVHALYSMACSTPKPWLLFQCNQFFYWTIFILHPSSRQASCCGDLPPGIGAQTWPFDLYQETVTGFEQCKNARHNVSEGWLKDPWAGTVLEFWIRSASSGAYLFPISSFLLGYWVFQV